ncbi:unnamed protein product [Auanema sp. JU1783]|nr:unnamed protein product [Auanema sp. JU1783]
MEQIRRHEQVRNYIAHRERVLESKSVINSRPVSRSKSVPARRTPMQMEQQRRIYVENQRLLQSLIKISCGRSPYSQKT